MLPLQFSWAAVADYCGHDRGTASSSDGPHTHGHDLAGEPADTAADAGNTGSADHDCGHCHGAAAGPLRMAPRLSLLASTALPPATAEPPALPGAGARPERPQWRALA